MKKAIALIVILAVCLLAGTTIGGDRFFTGGMGIPAIAGSGGVTAKLLAGKDASNPTAYVIPGSGGCGSGIAATTASAAGGFNLYSVPGLILTGVADNAVTAGHILVGGTTTPGRVKDSGQTTRTAIDDQTCIVGVAHISASTAGDVTFRYDGSGTYGTSPSAAFATLTDGATITWAITTLNANATVTLGGNRTLNITGPVDGGSYVLTVLQDGTGTRGLVLGTGCTWKVSGGGAGAITPSTTASAVDVLAFTYKAGTTSCLANFNRNFN